MMAVDPVVLRIVEMSLTSLILIGRVAARHESDVCVGVALAAEHGGFPDIFAAVVELARREKRANRERAATSLEDEDRLADQPAGHWLRRSRRGWRR